MLHSLGYCTDWHAVRIKDMIAVLSWCFHQPGEGRYYVHTNFKYISFELESDALLCRLKWGE